MLCARRDRKCFINIDLIHPLSSALRSVQLFPFHKYFLRSFLSPSGTCVMPVLVHLILSQRSQTALISFYFFHSCLQAHLCVSSVSLILLLSPSSVFFFFNFYLFIGHAK